MKSQRICMFVLICALSLPFFGGDPPRKEGVVRRGRSGGVERWTSNGVLFTHHPGEFRGQWRSDGPYETVIRIDRYYGDTRQIRRQMAKGLLPRTAKLMLAVHDCDRYSFSDTAAPEIDRIYFNGHYAGIVSGFDSRDSVTYVDIPIEWINFPCRPGDVAANRLRIDIDTGNSGDVWELYQYRHELYLPAPLPVYIVHGWTRSLEGVEALQEELDREYGIPSELAHVEMELTPLANAALMREELKELTAAYGVPRFNIIAHSKGGLDSRMLVDPYMLHNGIGMVNAVMQVGTPNGGSRLADIIMEQHNELDELLYFGAGVTGRGQSPGVHSLRPEVCRRFNERCCSPAVPVYTIAGSLRNYVRGDGHPDCLERGDREAFWSGYYVARLSYLHDFYSGNPERQGDGIVSVASAHCIGSALPQSPLIDIGDRGTEHSALLTMSAGDVLKAFEPIFTAVPDLSGQVPHEVKPPPLQLVSSTYSLRERAVSGHAGQSSACREMLSGRVPPGGSASCALTVLEGGDLLFALSGLPPEARCRLIGGDGAEMEFEVVDGGASGADGLRIAAVSNAVPGEYLLEVADGDGGGGFNFLASVAGEEEAFVLEVPFAAADAGEIFVTAAVSGSVPGRTPEEIRLFCHWRKSGGELWRVNQVPPEEFGDGSCFAGSFPVEDEGLYECAVVAELVLPDGASVFRTATFEVVLARPCGEIMQEGIVLKMPDGDGDGMAECLLAEVPVRVEQGGGYLLRGTLVTEDGVLAGRGAAWLEAPEAGEYQVNLEFSGGEIYASGVREYLLLEDISLERKVDGGSAPAAVADSGVSVVCSAVEFQHQPVTAAAVVAEKSYECTDEWGWGLGGMQLEVELEGDGISAAAQYSVYAQLLSGDGRVCAEALCSELRSAGETGRASVTLDFAGRDIATAGQDGPYHLECITVWAAAAPEKRYMLRTDYRSGAYSALDFAMPVKLPASAGSRDGVMVTERRKLEDGLWAMTVELTCGGDDYAFTAPFRLMPENPYAAEYRDFSFADGEDGVLDITLEMLEVLGRTGNGNRLLEPGEAISLDVLCRWDGAEELVPSLGVALLAGRVPEYVGLLSHQDDGKRHEYDNDSDGVLDAAEVMSGWNKWLQADSGDGTLLEAVDILRQGGAYRWTDGVFVPR